MELKEKILALGIAVVFFLLAIAFLGQIFGPYTHTAIHEECRVRYPFSEEIRDDPEAMDSWREQVFACEDELWEKSRQTSIMTSISLIIIALIVLLLSYFLIKIEPVSLGLVGGSILLLLYGSIDYYQHSISQLDQTILFSIVFIALIGIAYFKFSKNKIKKIKKTK